MPDAGVLDDEEPTCEAAVPCRWAGGEVDAQAPVAVALGSAHRSPSSYLAPKAREAHPWEQAHVARPWEQAREALPQDWVREAHPQGEAREAHPLQGTDGPVGGGVEDRTEPDHAFFEVHQPSL